MFRSRRLVAVGIALGVLLSASAASAQFGANPATSFFPDVPVRGPIVLYPTFSISEEFNDNIFLNNSRKESDWITGFTPGVRLVVEKATYRWAAGYNFTAEKYINHSELDNIFQRQQLFVTGVQRINPNLTLTLAEVFVEDNNSNLTSPEAVAIGRTTSRSNTLNPGLTWQFAPKSALRSSFSFVVQRYADPAAVGSNVYRLANDVLHDFSTRLTGVAGYEIAYIDVERQLGVSTHTPRVGATYRFTPFITASVLAGPTVSVSSQASSVSPYVNATVTDLFSWGSATAYFSRYVGTTGGVGGSSENTSIGATVQINSLIQNLVVDFGPRYNISTQQQGTGQTNDVRSFDVALRAGYQFTPWLAAVAGYRFFIQRSEGATTTLARDVDQNRLFFGLQFGVPFKFD